MNKDLFLETPSLKLANKLAEALAETPLLNHQSFEDLEKKVRIYWLAERYLSRRLRETEPGAEEEFLLELSNTYGFTLDRVVYHELKAGLEKTSKRGVWAGRLKSLLEGVPPPFTPAYDFKTLTRSFKELVTNIDNPFERLAWKRALQTSLKGLLSHAGIDTSLFSSISIEDVVLAGNYFPKEDFKREHVAALFEELRNGKNGNEEPLSDELILEGLAIYGNPVRKPLFLGGVELERLIQANKGYSEKFFQKRKDAQLLEALKYFCDSFVNGYGEVFERYLDQAKGLRWEEEEVKLLDALHRLHRFGEARFEEEDQTFGPARGFFKHWFSARDAALQGLKLLLEKSEEAGEDERIALTNYVSTIASVARMENLIRKPLLEEALFKANEMRRFPLAMERVSRVVNELEKGTVITDFYHDSLKAAYLATSFLTV